MGTAVYKVDSFVDVPVDGLDTDGCKHTTCPLVAGKLHQFNYLYTIDKLPTVSQWCQSASLNAISFSHWLHQRLWYQILQSHQLATWPWDVCTPFSLLPLAISAFAKRQTPILSLIPWEIHMSDRMAQLVRVRAGGPNLLCLATHSWSCKMFRGPWYSEQHVTSNIHKKYLQRGVKNVARLELSLGYWLKYIDTIIIIL